MDNLPITIGDLIVLSVLLMSGLLAFGRGFVHETLAVGAWIGAVLATIYGYPYAKPYARQLVGTEVVADVGAALVLFVVSLVVLSLVTGMLSRRVQDSALNALDRSMGFVFGLARGAVLVAVAYIALVWLLPQKDRHPDWIRDARSLPLVEKGAMLLSSLVPADTREKSTNAVDAAGEKARKALETRRMLSDIISPEPKGVPSDPGSSERGYDAKERSELERLMESGEGRK